MRLPGFAAEAALYKTGGGYRGVALATPKPGVIPQSWGCFACGAGCVLCALAAIALIETGPELAIACGAACSDCYNKNC